MHETIRYVSKLIVDQLAYELKRFFCDDLDDETGS